MPSAQVDETSVANNSPSQASNHPNDHFQRRHFQDSRVSTINPSIDRFEVIEGYSLKDKNDRINFHSSVRR